MNAPVLRSTLVTASFGIFFFWWGGGVIYVFYFKDSLVTGVSERNSEKFAISYQIKKMENLPLAPPYFPPPLPFF